MKYVSKIRNLFLANKKLLWSLRVLIAVGVAGVLCQIQMDYIESITYDFRVTLKPTSKVSGHVETIAIDSKTLKELQQDPTGASHKQFVQKLAKGKPRAVVYTFDPSKIKGAKSDLAEFAKAIEELPAFYYAANLLPKQGHESLIALKSPLENIPVFPAPKTVDLNIFAKDGVTRRFIYSFEGVPTLHPMLAQTFNDLEFAEDYRGLFEFIGTQQGFIDFRPSGTYHPTSFYDVMNGSVDTGIYKDKIVLVGKDIMETTKDYLRTPFSRKIVAMTNLEMHANIMDTLILNSAPMLPKAWVDYLLTALISILTIFVVLSLRPTQGLMILGLTVMSFAFVSYALFAFAGIWIKMAHPLLAIFICYYFFIPYRLIIENRRSWEYYQRNKLLTQVEELKSNFLRMMSHDLKTPLARIQGMAEIIQGQKETLTPEQDKAVQTIWDSTDELSEFIGSILNLSRVESNEIKLNMKSRDLNALLKTVVKQCEFSAQRKNIEIITEFEPLFSVKADEDLIKQVFTNLIENAIKYSPANSKVLISTDELEDRLVVQVADQGRGISEEDMPNIFSKFYRAKDVVNTDIAGSGLGLYLSKYFIELHSGDIEVESEPGQGSTFTVNLPIDNDEPTMTV